jgi:hypothetical protein
MSQQHNDRSTIRTDVPDLPDLPDATVGRLPEYLRALHALADAGADVVSSEELAAAAGVNSAKLRKDLSYLRSNGTRGVGYDVTQLIEKIEHVLGLNQHRAVALVGVGNLGHALAGYAGLPRTPRSRSLTLWFRVVLPVSSTSHLAYSRYRKTSMSARSTSPSSCRSSRSTNTGRRR